MARVFIIGTHLVAKDLRAFVRRDADLSLAEAAHATFTLEVKATLPRGSVVSVDTGVKVSATENAVIAHLAQRLKTVLVQCGAGVRHEHAIVVNLPADLRDQESYDVAEALYMGLLTASKVLPAPSRWQRWLSRALLAALLLTAAAPARGQIHQVPPGSGGGGGASYPTGSTTSGTIAADDQAVTLTGLTNLATATVQVTSPTWDGLLYPEARASSSETWHLWQCYRGDSSVPTWFVNQFEAFTDYFVTCPIAGVNEFRVRGTAGTSGSATVTLRASPAAAGFVEIMNPTAILTQTTIASGTGSRVRTGDWFGTAFTAAATSDVSSSTSSQVVRNIPADNYATGTITATEEVNVSLGGAATLSAAFSGSGTGNIEVQKSLDAVSWEVLDTINTAAVPSTVQLYAATGFRYFRAIGTTMASGTVTVQLRVTSTLQLASGGGGSGDGKILDGTAAGQADVIGSAPGGAEQALVVRNIPSGTQAVSGTFWQATQPVSGTVTVTDGSGSLTVDGTVTADTESAAAIAVNDNVLANSTGQTIGYTYFYDNTAGRWNRAWTAGSGVSVSTSNLPIFGAYGVRDDTTPGTTAEDSFGAFRISSNRNLFTTLRDAAGNERGANVNASNQLSVSVDNALTVTANAGTNLNTSALALSATQTDRTQKAQITDGTRDGTVKAASTAAAAADTSVVVALSPNSPIPAGTNAIGKLAANSGVDIGDVDILSVTPGTAATNLGKAEDAGHTSSDVGVMTLGVRKDTATQTTSADADYGAFSMDAYGAQFTRVDHPNRIRCTVTTSVATTITAVGGSCAAPGASLSIYITDVMFSASAAGIAADAFPTLKYGTGGTCGTGTTVFWGALTAAAIRTSDNFNTPIKIPANNEICWISSTAGSKFIVISGYIAP